MGMKELAMVMDFAGQIGILLARRLEHHLDSGLAIHVYTSTCSADDPYLGAVRELVRREVHFSE